MQKRQTRVQNPHTLYVKKQGFYTLQSNTILFILKTYLFKQKSYVMYILIDFISISRPFASRRIM